MVMASADLPLMKNKLRSGGSNNEEDYHGDHEDDNDMKTRLFRPFRLLILLRWRVIVTSSNLI
jgi:hypothetical protein